MKIFRLTLLYYFPFFLSVVFYLFHLYPTLVNPFFPGDSGIRLDQADRLIPYSGPRVWLPFLQSHIFLLYHLHVPLSLYFLIPAIYFVIFLFLINFIGIKFLGKTIVSVLFLTTFLFALTNNWLIIWLATQLMQEAPTFAFLPLLLYAYISRNIPLLFFLTSVSLLTREYFWVIFVVLGILPYLSGKVRPLPRIYWLFCGIPILWLIATNQPLWLANALPHPEITIPILFNRLQALGNVLDTSHLIPVYFVLVFGMAMTFLSKNAKSSLSDTFITLSFLSLGGISLYIILADPWQITPGNPRSIFPFFLFLPYLLIALLNKLSILLRLPRTIFSILLLLSVVPIFDFPPRNPLSIQKEPYYEIVSTTVSSYASSYRDTEKFSVGIVGIDQWNTYTQYLVGPLLYYDRHYLQEFDNPGNYPLIFAPRGFQHRLFSQIAGLTVGGKEIEIFVRSDIPKSETSH